MSPHLLDAWLKDDRRRPLLMGVLNVTEDSFSDGGRFSSIEAAIVHGNAMAQEGADWIDVGGESTRPGAIPVAEDQQIARVVPVIAALSKLDLILSVDTTRSAVAAAALDAGAAVVNDISAARDDPGMLSTIAERGAPIILMHMLGNPRTMQNNPRYENVVREVGEFLDERAVAAVKMGVSAHRILVDPGIGFGKTIAHNLQLLRDLSALAARGRPVVIGTSRKSFLGSLTARDDPADRIFGTAASVAWSVTNGAAVVRVHDVGQMRDVVTVARAIADEDFRQTD